MSLRDLEKFIDSVSRRDFQTGLFGMGLPAVLILFGSLAALPQSTDLLHATDLPQTPVFIDESRLIADQFRHVSPPTELRHLHLTMGSGLAAIDLDRDGWSDLWLGQGFAWTGSFRSPVRKHDTLLRNERGRFRDISAWCGLSTEWFTTGVACGDIDNDGFEDLFVTSLGRNLLFFNNGDGTFRPPMPAGPDVEAWNASCTLADIDADGILDVFVTRYVQVASEQYRTCVDTATGLGIVCPPRDFEFHHDLLLRGRGDGTFEDVSTGSGILDVPAAPGLGVVVIDANDDGASDLYVANDSLPNHLWVNDGSGRFTEEALISGTAINGQGLREAGMGVAAGDVTDDGRPDVIVTNYYDETNTLYRNEGEGFFLDVSDEIGIGAPSRSRLAFGVNFVDLNGDSKLDVFAANGHIHDRLAELGRNIPYEQCPQVFVSDSGLRLEDCSHLAGEIFRRTFVGRGSIVTDFDRDDRSDIVMTNLNDSPVVFRNVTSEHGQLIRLRLIGTRSSRHPIGAKVEVMISNSLDHLVRFQNGSDSYLSCSENVVLFGLRAATQPESLLVRWPSGHQETIASFTSGHEWAMIEGRTVEGHSIIYRLPL